MAAMGASRRYGAIDEDSAPQPKRGARPWRFFVIGGSVVIGCVVVAGSARGSSVMPLQLKVTPLASADVVDTVVPPVDDDVWERYKLQYEKTYEKEEEAFKRANFEKRMVKLHGMNAKNGRPVYGITEHSDRDEGAMAFMRGYQSRPDRETRSKPANVNVKTFSQGANAALLSGARIEKDLENSWSTPFAVVDFTKVDDVITPVKNQGQCGSCWAFSATEQIESQFVLSGAPPVTLSTQQTTSCTTPDKDAEECCNGCGGGDPSVAYEVIQESQGLSPDAWWPYMQSLTPDDSCTDSTCTKSCDKDLSELDTDYEFIGPYATISSYAYAVSPCTGTCDDVDLETLANVASYTPVSICINAESWDDYVGGVLTADACGGHSSMDLDHCVQLVGYNTVDDQPYWLVRNSWSTSWGEEGYIRLEFSENTNTCGIANEATIVHISGDWTER